MLLLQEGSPARMPCSSDKSGGVASTGITKLIGDDQ